MLTEVKAFSSLSAPLLPLDVGGRPETDLLQIRNIDGLDPVKASVNTSPFGSIDGTDYIGSDVLSRNVVLTVHPNPDWNEWTFESLRRLLYMYFMPSLPVRLVFYSDDMPAVQIAGIVESIETDLFSKDPQYLVSVVCPDPYFTALDAIVITGTSLDSPLSVTYDGNIEAGVIIRVSYIADGGNPSVITSRIGDNALTVGATVDAENYLEISSIPMKKFVQNVYTVTGAITSRMYAVTPGYSWPVLQPGLNEFDIVTNYGIQNWQLTYFERFGGL